METGDTLYPLFAAAPSGKRELERLQALDCRLRQHAKAEKADSTFAGLPGRKGLPEVPSLLLKIGGDFPVERQHAEGDVFLHHAYDAVLDHAHELYMSGYIIRLELIDARADGKDRKSVV